MNLDRFNGVTLTDRVNDVLAFSHFTENSVLAIEVRRRSVSDKELGTVGIRTGIRHGKYSRLVVLQMRLALTLELVARATHTGAGRITTLNHEIRDHAVEHDTVIEAVTGQAKETGAGHLGISSKHTHFDRALAGVHCNVDVLNIAHVAGKKPWIGRFCTDFF